MPDPVSTLVVSTLTGLAVHFLSMISKKTIKSLKDLFSENELKSILDQAFMEFRESCIKGKGAKEEKILLKVFEEFFTDDRTILEFRQVFEGRSDTVDFNLMNEIFVGICLERGIEIQTFDFFKTISTVIKNIEKFSRDKEEFRETFKLEYLAKIHTSLQKRGEETNGTFARFKYLRQLIIHNNRLQFTGIPHPQEKKDIELPSVFVMQRVRESVAEEDYRRMLQERAEDEAFTGEEIQLRQMMPVRTEEKKEPIKFDKVLDEEGNRRFVVLGKPGSGKSTLLKYLMLESARLHLEYHRDSSDLLFPILVEIRKFENALTRSNQPDYNILDYLYDSMRKNYNLTLPKGFFEKYLDSGRALLLFDGLDEVAAESRRAEIRHMISAFFTSFHSGNTIIVTSRIAGYSRARFSTTDYRHFTLEDFNDEEIETFIHQWYRSRMINPNEADTKADDLKKALERKPRIKELAKNPLLLTIIGIIHRYEAQLPEDRLVLYDKATEALLYTWESVKGIIDEKFKPEDKRRFLEKVAFHLQSIEKGDEAGTVIERDELYKILFPDFQNIFCCDNRQAQALVNEFLEKIRLRAGLLVELAPDQYGFAHKTFQEYFAAQWIANESKLNFDLKIMIDYVERFIDNAFWHETLLLALRSLPNMQAQKVLEYILDRDPKKIEAYFYHNHYFVMKFIAEQGRWLNDRGFVEKQIDDFFSFSWDEGKDRSNYSNYTWERFKDCLSFVSDSVAGSILSEKLLKTAEDASQPGDLRRECAQAVGHLGFKEKAVDVLLLLAEDASQEGSLRRECAQAVGHLGFKEKAVVDRLLFLVEDASQEVYLRRYCAEAVGHLGFKEKAVADRLLLLAEDASQEGYLRRDCTEAVGHLGFKEKAVADRLLFLAEDGSQAGYLRHSCAEAVGDLGFIEKAVEVLLLLAEDGSQAGYFRRDCAEAVGDLGFKEKAVEVLLLLAEDASQESDLRRSCAEAVGDLGFKEKAVEVLLLLAEDGSQAGSLRRDCAEAMGDLGFKEKAVHVLLLLVEDASQAGDLRRYCTEAVGDLGFKEKAVVDRLLLLAEDGSQAGDLRRDCAKAVGHLGFKEKAVADRLLLLAEDGSQAGSLRRYCVEAVGHLGFKEKAVADRLLLLAEDGSQAGSLRCDCVEAVGHLGFKEKAVVDRLLLLAEDGSQAGSLRCDCVEAVGDLGFKEKAVADRLLLLAEDRSQAGDLRRYCAEALGKIGEKDKAVDILIDLYLAQTDKYSSDACSIYRSLWKMTAE